MNIQSNITVYIKLVLVMAFWGVAFVSVKVLTKDAHPFAVAFMRFFTAAIILIPLLYRKNRTFYRLSLSQFAKVFFMGLTGVFLYSYFFFSGVQLLEAGRSSVIIAINPAVTTLFAIIFLKESYSWKKLVGLIMAITGALIVISRGDLSQIFSGAVGKGEVLLLCAVFTWMTYTIFGKYALKKITPFEASAWGSLIGAILLFPFAYSSGLVAMVTNLSIYGWMHVANLGVLCTSFAFIWYYEAVSEIGAAQTSSFINLIPLFGITSGIIFLKEIPSVSLILGGIIVIFGVYIINRKTK